MSCTVGAVRSWKHPPRPVSIEVRRGNQASFRHPEGRGLRASEVWRRGLSGDGPRKTTRPVRRVGGGARSCRPNVGFSSREKRKSNGLAPQSPREAVAYVQGAAPPARRWWSGKPHTTTLGRVGRSRLISPRSRPSIAEKSGTTCRLSGGRATVCGAAAIQHGNPTQRYLFTGRDGRGAPGPGSGRSCPPAAASRGGRSRPAPCSRSPVKRRRTGRSPPASGRG